MTAQFHKLRDMPTGKRPTLLRNLMTRCVLSRQPTVRCFRRSTSQLLSVVFAHVTIIISYLFIYFRINRRTRNGHLYCFKIQYNIQVARALLVKINIEHSLKKNVDCLFTRHIVRSCYRRNMTTHLIASSSKLHMSPLLLTARNIVIYRFVNFTFVQMFFITNYHSICR